MRGLGTSITSLYQSQGSASLSPIYTLVNSETRRHKKSRGRGGVSLFTELPRRGLLGNWITTYMYLPAFPSGHDRSRGFYTPASD